MPATGDGRAPGAGDPPGALAGARDGRARSRTVREERPAPTTVAAAPIPHPRGTPAQDSAPTQAARPAPLEAAPLKVLVIEDDASDAELIKAAVAGSGASFEIHWAHSLDHAVDLLAPPPPWTRRGRTRGTDFGCVLLDLAAPTGRPATAAPDHGRPDHSRLATTGAGAGEASDGLDGLRELLRRAPQTAVVVLTDAAGAELGAAAVAAGAQDFLIKHETNGPLLARALRYAVERKRADESQRRLVEAELRGQENARLQRHLLPTPLLDGAGLAFTRRYRPGRRRALLGGDFYDAVRTDDGTVHVVIGDVCGHGPDEAALGVALRIAWRTLVFAGLTGEELLTTLQHVLEHERRSDEIFATLCMLVIEPGDDPTGPAARTDRTAKATKPAGAPAVTRADGRSPAADGAVEHARLYLAGHPVPLLLGPDHTPELLPAGQAGPALGLLPCDDCEAAWPAQRLELRPGWRLLLYTDGLVEGRVGAGSRRLGQDGLAELIGDHQAAGLTRGRLVDSAIAEVEELNGGALTDDVAVLLLERNPAPLILG
ncbi:SpoIIE family protein phosphatase [Kitasatospora sp. NBC_00240]|uniref:PP2C family protein-serine/threonine phosphatase n=1 Tax=Kitasatospora sp. NBC_00240 TaxID=2903567 RepID=UPI002257F86E|nr:SpoIIE family protein phosphatase [Kitasatospora sp. NBC_00240]MCX5212139.1 SpoIIE family protein phosphatase [Kitasatospora sp. NBC_00240]